MNGGLVLLAVVIALGAGDFPPTTNVEGPTWTSAHTLQFAYQPYGEPLAQYVANDDGTGFAPTPAPADEPTISPDGRHRYAIDPVTNVLSIDGVSTRRAVFNLNPSSVAWSPDSSRLAFASAGRIWVTGADRGDQHAVHAGVAVAWASPDKLVVVLDYFDADVSTMRPDGSRARRVLTGVSSQGGLAVSADGTQVAFTAAYRAPYVYGSTLYVASLAGLDRDVRRVSPDPCSGGCGTDGPDRIVGGKVGDLIIAGAGDDVIHAGDGQNVVYGQWGNDTILTGSYVDTVYGGGGNDIIRTGAGDDTIFSGAGRDIVNAGKGDDHVIANDGERDIIDCGPGDDRARVDKRDSVRSCEHVTVVP